jgi:hypothetical protein
VEAAFTRFSTRVALAAPAAAASGISLELLTIVGTAFLAGGLTGASMYAAFVGPPEAPPAEVETVEPAPAVVPPPAAPVTPEPPPVADEPIRKAEPPAKKRARRPNGLARERQILDAARAALRTGHPTEALDAIDRHERRFAGGKLSEEREALRISVLVALGRRSEAERRAKEFEARHPESMFAGAIEKALSR